MLFGWSAQFSDYCFAFDTPVIVRHGLQCHIQPVGETWVQRGGAVVPPVITIVVVGNSYEIRAQVSSGSVGDSTAYTKVQIHDPSGGFALS